MLPRTHFERFKIIRYGEGEFFKPHHDGYCGRKTSSGFCDSGRLATLFVYLNTLRDGGGATRFTALGLDILPERGMAVVHLPSDTRCMRDDRTEHEGCPAKADKWLFNCQMWADPKADGPASDGMRDSETPVLSDTLI